MVVDAAITVDTSELSWPTVGEGRRNRSAAIAFSAVLSRTTTASALRHKRFRVSTELYGCTTTSDWLCDWFGNTEYVWISFLGKWSFSCSSRYDPIPDPVPPAIECASTNPSSESELSASRSIMSISVSCTADACAYPDAQLLPAPPPSGEM